MSMKERYIVCTFKKKSIEILRNAQIDFVEMMDFVKIGGITNNLNQGFRQYKNLVFRVALKNLDLV